MKEIFRGLSHILPASTFTCLLCVFAMQGYKTSPIAATMIPVAFIACLTIFSPPPKFLRRSILSGMEISGLIYVASLGAIHIAGIQQDLVLACMSCSLSALLLKLSHKCGKLIEEEENRDKEQNEK